MIDQERSSIIFLNGLLYDQNRWIETCQHLFELSYNLLTFDFYGQGRTVESNKIPTQPISLDNQVEDLYQLIVQEVGDKAVILVGLSYGGAVAQRFGMKYPNLIEKILLIAPYIQPINQLESIVEQQSYLTNLFVPFLSFSECFDFHLKNLMGVEVFKDKLEKGNLDNIQLHSEGTFRLAQGIKHLHINPIELEKLPKNSVSLLIPKYDEYTSVLDYLAFWNNIPSRVKSNVEILPTMHRVPGAEPKALADWIKKEVV
ncbi:alpha/beta hydrolase [Bernardetia sp. ABR2-2B]|uniref:alpha/beta fold hydrolase n=1 Tax=Bernardetia sp. ABR2-2B TaxID=3127472 RepID=UPI0030D3F909